jgi:hypothetical protein
MCVDSSSSQRREEKITREGMKKLLKNPHDDDVCCLQFDPLQISAFLEKMFWRRERVRVEMTHMCVCVCVCVCVCI